jgi:nicotinate-nucleotide adenylyltransferase
MARAAAAQCELSKVLVIPAGNPPHRTATASFADRFRMVEIACGCGPLFEPSPIEDCAGKSYTVDTVERLRAEYGPDVAWYFIIGADAFDDIESWHRWRDLVPLVTFAIVGRPGAEYRIPNNVCAKRVEGVELPVSASDIRAKLAEGQDNLDLPAGVLNYIRERKLYGVS